MASYRQILALCLIMVGMSTKHTSHGRWEDTQPRRQTLCSQRPYDLYGSQTRGLCYQIKSKPYQMVSSQSHQRNAELVCQRNTRDEVGGVEMLVPGASNQQHYPWATLARTVPTHHQKATTRSSLQALVHFCIWPVEGGQAPTKLLSGGATSQPCQQAPIPPKPGL